MRGLAGCLRTGGQKSGQHKRGVVEAARAAHVQAALGELLRNLAPAARRIVGNEEDALSRILHKQTEQAHLVFSQERAGIFHAFFM